LDGTEVGNDDVCYVADTDTDAGRTGAGDDGCVTNTEDGPSKLSFPAFPSVNEYIAPVSSDICVSPESVLRCQTKNPINDPFWIVTNHQ
jgi:hypothetical protein